MVRMELCDNDSFDGVAPRQLPLENRQENIPVKFKRRKLSAHREFPEGCGRFTAGVSGTHGEFVPHNITADHDPIKFLKKFPWRKISATRDFPPGCGRNAQRLGTEENLKSDSSEKGNSVYRERTSEVNHENYHCRQGKQVVNYKSSATMRINLKNHKTENSEGLNTRSKVPPTGKVAYIDPSQIVARHAFDNVRYDKKHENVINGDKAIVSHVRSIEVLNLFRSFLKEEEKKLKEQGCSIKRIDLVAYNRLKERWDFSGEAILGSIPGVEVGDKFQFRVELYIVGLHRHFESGIDYMEKNGKIIATSIVLSGGYDNDLYDPDVLVYSGQGGKSMHGNKWTKDQKLEGGNLALVNSIDTKNFVRVIFGSKEVKDSNSIYSRGKKVLYYVYNGLYKVEYYWQETGCSGNCIFKFQLRRVEGHSNPHSVKNSNKM
ncbi:hypothetical protein NE237_004837 [Protea cynaroides]|uniref:YDG domain-containing protein n=1 Tax=Protea cynaroides TaxID=273540 RepID=A0A9Q0KJG5_9MAGN|nr:hypothetical protein NE237_004837 [Protea cynaroides]